MSALLHNIFFISFIFRKKVKNCPVSIAFSEKTV